METAELLAIISNGEDTKHQFKANFASANAIAAELVAMSNTCGGLILVGVNDNGSINGMSFDEVGKLNQYISNASTNNVVPPVNPKTQNFTLTEGMVIVITVEKGINKPYMDKQGYIWVKAGADKRKVTTREELQRMYQQSGLIHADQVPVAGVGIENIDRDYLDEFLQQVYDMRLDEQTGTFEQLLNNMNLVSEGQLNLCGALLFAKRPHLHLPVCIVKAVAFYGNDITEQHYIDSKDINGKMADVFEKSVSFVLGNIRHQQNGQDFNSVGEPEIPRLVLQELIANALIHRDYFVSAPIRLLVFVDRVEIISPGHLPNNLTIDNIKLGNSNIRNPILASFATRLLPYRGLGSGIMRAMKAMPSIEFVDDREGNLFKVIIPRSSV